MKKYTGFITLFTVTILIFPFQADAVWWKLIRNKVVTSIATEILKEDASKKEIQNICHVMAMSFAYTYFARVNDMSRELFNSKLKKLEANLASGEWEKHEMVVLNKMNVTIADHIYDEPMSTFPVNLESTNEEKQRSAEEYGSEMYQECMNGLNEE